MRRSPKAAIALAGRERRILSNEPRVIDVLIEASSVVPVEPHARILDDHAVAIDGDVIVDVLPQSEAKTKYAPKERVSLAGHVVMPTSKRAGST